MTEPTPRTTGCRRDRAKEGREWGTSAFDWGKFALRKCNREIADAPVCLPRPNGGVPTYKTKAYWDLR